MRNRKTVYTHRMSNGKPFLAVEIDRRTRHVIVRVSDAVAVLVYIKDSDTVLLVEQGRPAAVSMANPTGSVMETVAGRMDYEATVRELAAAELREEAGVCVEPERIKILNKEIPLFSSVGVLTERITFAFVEVASDEVDPNDRIYGTGENERIKRKFFAASELEDMRFDTVTSFGLVQWFLRTRAEKKLAELRTQPKGENA